MLATTRLEGDSGILTWFGAPPSRQLVFTVGNLGSAPVKDPVFRIGTAHGVFAPQWEEQQWRGTIESGRKAQIKLPVELTAGAHGDYQVSLKYGSKVLAEQPWGSAAPGESRSSGSCSASSYRPPCSGSAWRSSTEYVPAPRAPRSVPGATRNWPM